MRIKKFLAAVFAAIALSFSGAGIAQSPTKPDIIEVIELSGVINQATAAQVEAQVEKINENPKIKGVILVINSPGGGVSSTLVLVQALAKIKVPVMAFCEYECASGGVYALTAPSIKYVAVRSDTIGGSVGVIMHLQRFNRLLDWAKIDSETYKSGSLKDAGNPTRAAQDDERAYLQGIVDQMAQSFYAAVSKARPNAKMEELKTARIFIGQEIVRVGLADKVMDWDEVKLKAKAMSGSKNAYTRDELKKLTKDATEAANMSLSKPPAIASDGWTDHFAFLVETIREIKAGESVRFEYRMPYRF